MSPASKSKSKDKKAGKEPPKVSSKSSGGTPASGYNPLLGTFHTFETPPVPSPSALQINARFRNIDDTDDQNGNTFGAGIEYDSVSNNDSWSGDSEDHKEKASQQQARQESVPGADNDKREKIRQKNERKHQRQKERRAQELHERCSGYLMSRKLEALAQQLVSMGFSQERAMMALILNEGRVEESVAWLFEVGEEDKRVEHTLDGLKIDISDELARIADMELRYKSSKQEVERAIVACEGDIEKAEEMLKAQKQEPPKPEETGDPPSVVSNGTVQVATAQNTMRVQIRSNSSAIVQQKRDERDFNYTTKVVPITAGPSLDPGTKSMKKLPPKSEWAKPQPIPVPADKRWPGSGSNPAVSCSLPSPLQASPPPPKVEARYLAVGNELKNLQLGSVREPVIVMQRPQSANAKQAPSSSVSSSPPGPAMGWYPSNVDIGKPNGPVPSIAISRSISPGGVSSNLLYNQHSYQSQQPQFVQSSSSSSSSIDSRGNGLWSRGGVSPTLSAAASLGLFSGLGGNANGSSGSSSLVDWNTGGSMLHLDYTNIDWSLDRGTLSSVRPNGSWGGALQTNGRTYESFGYSVAARSAMGPVLSSGNGNGGSIPGLQEGVTSNGNGGSIPGLQEGVTSNGGGGSWEWTSPFEERDLFSLPRQFVSSPSL